MVNGDKDGTKDVLEDGNEAVIPSGDGLDPASGWSGRDSIGTWLNITEVAALAGVSTQAAYQRAHGGRFRPTRRGPKGQLLVARAAAEEYARTVMQKVTATGRRRTGRSARPPVTALAAPRRSPFSNAAVLADCDILPDQLQSLPEPLRRKRMEIMTEAAEARLEQVQTERERLRYERERYGRERERLAEGRAAGARPRAVVVVRRHFSRWAKTGNKVGIGHDRVVRLADEVLLVLDDLTLWQLAGHPALLETAFEAAAQDWSEWCLSVNAAFCQTADGERELVRRWLTGLRELIKKDPPVGG